MPSAAAAAADAAAGGALASRPRADANAVAAGVVGGENLEGAGDAEAGDGLGTWLDRKMEGILSANRTLVMEQAKVAAGARVEQVAPRP